MMTLSKPQRPGRSSTGRQFVLCVRKFGNISRPMPVIAIITPNSATVDFRSGISMIFLKKGCVILPYTFEHEQVLI
jgi:hypothetical protein